MSHLLTLLVKV